MDRKAGSALYYALTLSVLSGLLAGVFPTVVSGGRGYSVVGRLMALGFGLFFYSGVFDLLSLDWIWYRSLETDSGIFHGC